MHRCQVVLQGTRSVRSAKIEPPFLPVLLTLSTSTCPRFHSRLWKTPARPGVQKPWKTRGVTGDRTLKTRTTSGSLSGHLEFSELSPIRPQNDPPFSHRLGGLFPACKSLREKMIRIGSRRFPHLHAPYEEEDYFFKLEDLLSPAALSCSAQRETRSRETDLRARGFRHRSQREAARMLRNATRHLITQ